MSRIPAVLAAAVALAAGVGCGGSDGPGPDAAPLDVFGPYQGEDADRFGEVLRGFERSSGIDVRYAGSSDLVRDLLERATDPRSVPDIAVVPQAGVVRELVDEERILPLPSGVAAVVRENYATGAGLGEIDQALYTVPFRITIKSLVWYAPRVFAEYGWSPPETRDELDALVESISRDSELAPWCFAIAAGSATGWAATDWVEDLVLRRGGAEAYQRWALGRTSFSDPEIAGAFDEFEELVLAQGRTFGGVDQILGTLVQDAVDPLLGDPPGCALFKQADFAVSWMPEGTDIGPDGDVDFFILPGSDADQALPVVVGADQIVHFRDSPRATALLAYLAGPEAAAIWVRRGGFISANAQVEADTYPREYLRQIQRAAIDAGTPVYDASDQMPPEIGSGLLWRLITLWIGGSIDYDELAARVDAERSAEARGALRLPDVGAAGG